MIEPYCPTTSFVDVTLPMLPGKVATATFRVDAGPSTDTVTLSRAEITAVMDEQVEIEDMKTMIVERPEAPYEGWTKAQLYRRAKAVGLPGRSTFTKAQRLKKLVEFEGR
jgi:hypothetical protein